MYCYGCVGSRSGQTERYISPDGRSIEVTEVLEARLAPDHRYFKVRGENGACYIVRNDVESGLWELTMYDRTGAIG